MAAHEALPEDATAKEQRDRRALVQRILDLERSVDELTRRLIVIEAKLDRSMKGVKAFRVR